MMGQEQSSTPGARFCFKQSEAGWEAPAVWEDPGRVTGPWPELGRAPWVYKLEGRVGLVFTKVQVFVTVFED